MKIIYLIRHSEPLKDKQLKNEEIPLSENGKLLAQTIATNLFKENIDEIWSSEYKRAIETAQYIAQYNNLEININSNFNERKLGNIEGVLKEFWLEQLFNEDAKVDDGESRKEVTLRMLNGLDKILKSSSKNIVVVSHATAITFLLMKYCDLKEASLEGKRRWLTFNNKTVINDSFRTPEIFKLCFDENKIISIDRIEY